MSLTCCTGFQRVVEALNEFQIRSRKFKPAFLLTGFTVTTDASLLLRVFLQFARLVLVLHLRKIGEVVIFLFHSIKFWLLSRKAIAIFKAQFPLDFIFTSSTEHFFKPFNVGQGCLLNGLFSTRGIYSTVPLTYWWTLYSLSVTVITRCYNIIFLKPHKCSKSQKNGFEMGVACVQCCNTPL